MVLSSQRKATLWARPPPLNLAILLGSWRHGHEYSDSDQVTTKDATWFKIQGQEFPRNPVVPLLGTRTSLQRHACLCPLQCPVQYPRTENNPNINTDELTRKLCLGDEGMPFAAAVAKTGGYHGKGNKSGEEKTPDVLAHLSHCKKQNKGIDNSE